jgi:hypothetical protein
MGIWSNHEELKGKGEGASFWHLLLLALWHVAAAAGELEARMAQGLGGSKMLCANRTLVCGPIFSRRKGPGQWHLFLKINFVTSDKIV